jgi:hypothetical protein
MKFLKKVLFLLLIMVSAYVVFHLYAKIGRNNHANKSPAIVTEKADINRPAQLLAPDSMENTALAQNINQPPAYFIYTAWFSSGQGQEANIENVLKGKQGDFKVGDDVWGYRLVDIAQDKIKLQKNNKDYLVNIGGFSRENPLIEVSPSQRLVNLSYLTERFGSVGDIFNNIFFLPDVRGGRIYGLRIIQINNDDVLAKSGIKNGDVIKNINGQSLTDLRTINKIYNDIKDENIFEITLERDSKDVVLDYTVIR